MFGNMGCHVIKFPSGKFGFVGSIPTSLGEAVPATTADVMGCRTFRGDDGALLAWKFPTFPSEDAARDFAKAKGVNLAN